VSCRADAYIKEYPRRRDSSRQPSSHAYCLALLFPIRPLHSSFESLFDRTSITLTFWFFPSLTRRASRRTCTRVETICGQRRRRDQEEKEDQGESYSWLRLMRAFLPFRSDLYSSLLCECWSCIRYVILKSRRSTRPAGILPFAGAVGPTHLFIPATTWAKATLTPPHSNLPASLKYLHNLSHLYKPAPPLPCFPRALRYWIFEPPQHRITAREDMEVEVRDRREWGDVES
jgi:hypothetical protein